MLERKEIGQKEEQIIDYCNASTRAILIMEPTHARLHTQTTLVRKVVNDMALEDRVIAMEYQRKKVEKRKSLLRYVLQLQTENLDIE